MSNLFINATVACESPIPSQGPGICREQNGASRKLRSLATCDKRARQMPAGGLHGRKSGRTGDRASCPLDCRLVAMRAQTPSPRAKPTGGGATITAMGLPPVSQLRTRGGASRPGDQHRDLSSHTANRERTSARGGLRAGPRRVASRPGSENAAIRGTPASTLQPIIAMRRRDSTQITRVESTGQERGGSHDHASKPKPSPAMTGLASRGQCPRPHRGLIAMRSRQPWNGFQPTPRRPDRLCLGPGAARACMHGLIAEPAPLKHAEDAGAHWARTCACCRAGRV
jgi:hypothetical protein